MNYSIEELERRVNSEYANTNDLLIVVTSSNTTTDLILKAIKKANSTQVLEVALKSPLLNDEIFRAIYERGKASSELFPLIISNPLCTREMYDYFLRRYLNTYNNNIQFLINSPLARESDYLIIVGKIDETNRNTYIPALLKGHALSQKVIQELLKYRLTMEQLQYLLNVPFVDGDLFKDILSKYIDKGNTDIKYILQHPKMTKEILSEVLDNIVMDSVRIEAILQSNLCDDEIMSKLFINDDKIFDEVLNHPKFGRKTMESLINNYSTARYSDANIIKLINHPLMDEQLLLMLVNAISDIPSYKRQSNGNYSSIDKISLISAILKNPACSEKVLIDIAKNFSDNEEIYHTLKGQSLAVQKALYLNSKSLSDEIKIEEYLSLPGLTTQDMIEGLNYGNINYIKALLNRDIDDIKLNEEIVFALCKESNETTSIREYRNIISNIMLPNRTLSEDALVEIIDCFYKIDVEMIYSVLKNPNAKTKVEKAARRIIDSFRNESIKEALNKETDILHKKIVSELFNIEEEKDVTEQLRMNVEDGLSTMLWGPSGVGKTARVFEVDPTATMIILKDGMLPEEVVGGKEPNGAPGEVYPPHWYTVLCKKCMEEPDRQHILFIDEFTNVKETVKNLVWNVIGARQVADHEEWRLPENCSVVLAGNRPEESTSVKLDNIGGVMSAPLHNRVDQMIEIKFDIDEWQKWALETDPKTGNLRIHPVVYSFCVSHADDVMFTQFDPDKITEQFLTPRKWETLSKIIYKAEERGKAKGRGGPLTHPSYERIYNAIGHNDTAKAFIAHYEREPIDMNKIIMGEYKETDFPSIDDKLYALGMIIANYNGDEIAVETFINDCLGDEYMSIYQNMKSARKGVLDSIAQKENMMRL